MQFFTSRVDWEQANCLGMDTNQFYFVEEKRQSTQDKMEMMAKLRKICTSCPIWEKCLEWGFANETNGVWGGLSSMERNSIARDKRDEHYYTGTHSMKMYGITLRQIKKAIK